MSLSRNFGDAARGLIRSERFQGDFSTERRFLVLSEVDRVGALREAPWLRAVHEPPLRTIGSNHGF